MQGCSVTKKSRRMLHHLDSHQTRATSCTQAIVRGAGVGTSMGLTHLKVYEIFYQWGGGAMGVMES